MRTPKLEEELLLSAKVAISRCTTRESIEDIELQILESHREGKCHGYFGGCGIHYDWGLMAFCEMRKREIGCDYDKKLIDFWGGEICGISG